MQEGVAADVALLGRIAIEQAVDAREVGVAVARAAIAELQGVALRQFDALRRIRMAREEVEAGVGRAADGAEVSVGRHRLQEAGSGGGVEAGLAARLDADGVRLELLVAGELGEAQLAADQRDIGRRIAAQDVLDHLGGQHFLGFLLLPLQAVIGRHVTHLVRDDRGKLGRIIGERQQTTRNVEIAARQREGVYVGRVENGDPVGLAGITGHGGQVSDDLCDHALELRVGILAAIGGQDAGMLTLGEFGETVVAGNRVDGDRILGRPEGRFLDIATRQAGQRLAAGDKRHQPRHARKSGGQSQHPVRSGTRHVKRQVDFLSVSRLRQSNGPQSHPTLCALREHGHNVAAACGLAANYGRFRATRSDVRAIA